MKGIFTCVGRSVGHRKGTKGPHLNRMEVGLAKSLSACCCTRAAAGEHRVTFMVAFWRDIRIRPRPDGLPGASQPFPLHTSHTRAAVVAGGSSLHPAGGAGPSGVASGGMQKGGKALATSLSPMSKGAAKGAAKGYAKEAEEQGRVQELAAGAEQEGAQGEGAAEQQECGACGLPGAECFNTSMRPVWEHTWPSAFASVLQEGEAGPESKDGSAEQADETGVGKEGGEGAEATGAVRAKKVSAVAVQPVWEAVNPTAKNAVHLLKGLPKYAVCFQGF